MTQTIYRFDSKKRFGQSWRSWRSSYISIARLSVFFVEISLSDIRRMCRSYNAVKDGGIARPTKTQARTIDVDNDNRGQSSDNRQTIVNGLTIVLNTNRIDTGDR